MRGRASGLFGVERDGFRRRAIRSPRSGWANRVHTCTVSMGIPNEPLEGAIRLIVSLFQGERTLRWDDQLSHAMDR